MAEGTRFDSSAKRENDILLFEVFRQEHGGRDKIRTCDGVTMLVFKTSALNHSATLPCLIITHLSLICIKS